MGVGREDRQDRLAAEESQAGEKKGKLEKRDKLEKVDKPTTNEVLVEMTKCSTAQSGGGGWKNLVPSEETRTPSASI